MPVDPDPPIKINVQQALAILIQTVIGLYQRWGIETKRGIKLRQVIDIYFSKAFVESFNYQSTQSLIYQAMKARELKKLEGVSTKNL